MDNLPFRRFNKENTMAHLNRSSLSFIGFLVSLGTASIIGCGFDTNGSDGTTTAAGGSAGAGGEGGTAGMGGMAGAGGGMGCTPGSKRPCYTGPVETANIGNCKPGAETCLADGTDYGACEGDVVPVLEDCSTTGIGADEDCDGLTDLEDSECLCEVGTAVACDTKLQGICAAGTAQCGADGKSLEMCIQTNQASTVDNCATPEDDDCNGTATAMCTGDPKGTYTTAGTSAMDMDDSIYAVTLTPDGGYAIAGVIDGSISPDAYGITKGTIYVAKLDAAGALQWKKEYPCTTAGAARGIAASPTGDIIVAGEFTGTVNFDGVNPVKTADMASDIFILKLDGAGIYQWHKTFGDTKDQVAMDVAVDGNGNIFITGYADTDPFKFDVDTLDPNQLDVFVASFNAGGMHRWSKLYVNGNVQRGRDLALTANGDVIIVGDTAESLDLGGGLLTKGGSQDVIVARYKGDDGTHVWSKLFGDTSAQVGRSVAVGAGGNILITGGFAGTIQWDVNAAMTAVGMSDVFVAKLDSANGNYLMHAQGGKLGTSTGTGVGSDESGNVVVSGYFNGTIDFGDQAVTATAGANDAFVVKLREWDWISVWTKAYGATGSQYGWDVAVANDGSAITGGGFFTELVVPPNPKIDTTGGSDIFAVLVNP
jgi:hypothetical protein